jgi:hypothetical protein
MAFSHSSAWDLTLCLDDCRRVIFLNVFGIIRIPMEQPLERHFGFGPTHTQLSMQSTEKSKSSVEPPTSADKNPRQQVAGGFSTTTTRGFLVLVKYAHIIH